MSVPNLITLARPIVAVQLEPSTEGSYRMGLLSQLPSGAELAVCGRGFNDRTAKVSCHGHFYFVFLQDIELAERIEYGRDAHL